jgi:cysteinyl-tRNA synthetase
MIAIISGLIERGMAYQSGGNIYFEVARFPEYGKLSGNQLAALLEGVRDAADPRKRSPEDFALWKLAEPGRELAWDSPWGRGFPGWHIECSAMSMKYLGPRFDIHTGGVDNIFPHHEDEIAQSEGFTDQPLVGTWVHAQHLLADGLKMAKSTGNAYTRADIEARGFEPLALRYMYAVTHYRSRLNFTFTALRGAATALRRLRLAAWRLATAGAAQPVDARSPWLLRFDAALDDDMNLPRALAAIWDLLRRAPDVTASQKLGLLLQFDEVLGFGLREWLAENRPLEGAALTQPAHLLQLHLPEQVQQLIERRAGLRRQGRYQEADQLRNLAAAQGYHLHDTPAATYASARSAAELPQIASSRAVPDGRGQPDSYAFSVNLLARDSRPDLERCIASIARQRAGADLEIVVIDNGSTDDTVAYLQSLQRSGLRDRDGREIPLRIIFADHNLGFAAGRNATMRASRGRIVLLLDTSIELRAPIWEQVARALADEQVGLVGPYGLATNNLKDFVESEGPDVDAIEGYLMAFRRALLSEIGWCDEKFRFYRLLDVHTSFFVKAAGYRLLVIPELAGLLEKHPHREWFGLTEEERATRSKKNFDIYYRRWHHGQSLMSANYVPELRWFGHDNTAHSHPPDELPPPGQPHSHNHQHWPDHAHEHPHYHDQ